jgi:hypothetical protein
MPELDIEQIIAEATPAEVKIPLCVRGDLNLRHQELAAQLATVKDGQQKKLANQIGELEAAMRAAEHTFHLRRLPPDEWDALRKPYVRPGTGFLDPDRMSEFAAPAIAASAVSPAMTEEQARRLLGKLNSGQRDVLFDGALRVNIGVVDIPFSEEASKIRGRPSSSPNSKRPAS